MNCDDINIARNFALTFICFSSVAAMSQIPHLSSGDAGLVQLFVNDKPFLCLAGELQNSSTSSAQFMEAQYDNLKRMHLNTLFFPIAWEQIEPLEGKFDFSELDRNIALARKYHFKLVLVWFGSYKNGMSTYIPSWVKQDDQRFPRVCVGARNDKIEVLSPFSKSNVEADVKAYVKLLEHIRDIDSTDHTFILAQVENEPGLLGDSRDRSLDAAAAWEDGVPSDLLNGLTTRKLHPALLARLPNLQTTILSHTGPRGWIEVFGKEADESFMADAYSRYVNRVAEAGKTVYALPTFINTWLSCDDANILELHGVPLKHNMTTAAGGGNRPGDYPSGGCCPQVLDVWRINAPSLDIFSPDVYLHNFQWVCEQYGSIQDVLLIPEMRRDDYGARRIMYAYGQYNCIAASPFGVDTLKAKDAPFARVFDLLHKSRTVLLQTRMGIDSFGFFFDEMDRPGSSIEEERVKVWGDWKLTVKRAHVFGVPGPGCGIVIRQEDDRFFCIGWGYSLYFTSTTKSFTGILRAKELESEHETGRLNAVRWLNGDETRSGACLTMPNEEPDEGGFPIAITIPSRTAIAECIPYAI